MGRSPKNSKDGHSRNLLSYGLSGTTFTRPWAHLPWEKIFSLRSSFDAMCDRFAELDDRFTNYLDIRLALGLLWASHIFTFVRWFSGLSGLAYVTGMILQLGCTRAYSTGDWQTTKLKETFDYPLEGSLVKGFFHSADTEEGVENFDASEESSAGSDEFWTIFLVSSEALLDEYTIAQYLSQSDREVPNGLVLRTNVELVQPDVVKSELCIFADGTLTLLALEDENTEHPSRNFFLSTSLTTYKLTSVPLIEYDNVDAEEKI
ncbi:hypothetical protein RvY_13624 [Ramazzottius varieornatus]|uniref:Uncharacterized protein n=1 Tax=Ramazzottius varieornatus TaxID=947166 RepID=A0A1D1VNJ8_RAMVA|nr:hypothetical protein RvY_13624 [Ramazzottius varieornatus]